MCHNEGGASQVYSQYISVAQKHTFHQFKSTSVHVWVGEHMKRPKVESIRQAPNTLIAHLQKIASPPALLHEPSPPLASVNNLLISEKLKCACVPTFFHSH